MKLPYSSCASRVTNIPCQEISLPSWLFQNTRVLHRCWMLVESDEDQCTVRCMLTAHAVTVFVPRGTLIFPFFAPTLKLPEGVASAYSSDSSPCSLCAVTSPLVQERACDIDFACIFHLVLLPVSIALILVQTHYSPQQGQIVNYTGKLRCGSRRSRARTGPHHHHCTAEQDHSWRNDAREQQR